MQSRPVDPDQVAARLLEIADKETAPQAASRPLHYDISPTRSPEPPEMFEALFYNDLVFYIASKPKKEEVKVHRSRLEAIFKNGYRAFYTDGLQGRNKDGRLTNAAAFVEIGPGSKLIQGKTTNLGPGIEVADAEVVAVAKAIGFIGSSRVKPRNTYFFFVESQAAILRIKKCNDYYSQLISKKASVFKPPRLQNPDLLVP